MEISSSLTKSKILILSEKSLEFRKKNLKIAYLTKIGGEEKPMLKFHNWFSFDYSGVLSCLCWSCQENGAQNWFPRTFWAGVWRFLTQNHLALRGEIKVF